MTEPEASEAPAREAPPGSATGLANLNFAGVASPLLAIVLSLVVSGALIALSGLDPLAAFAALLDGSFGSTSSILTTLVRATPLLLTGLSFAVALRGGVINVGAEGQLYAGAIVGTAVALGLPDAPAVLLIPLVLLAGGIGGALWALIPGVLRAYRGVSEIVVTLMFNFIAIIFTQYIVNTSYGPLGEKGASYSQSPLVPEAAELPTIVPRSSVHAGLAIGVVLAVMFTYVIRSTSFGYRLRAVGASPRAARFAGIATPRVILTVMLMSGAVAGLAGIGEVVGLRHRLFADFSPGYGYTGIAVALLARSSPIGVILSAVFFGALEAGSTRMQQVAGVESSIGLIVQATTIIFLVANVTLGRRLPSRKRDPQLKVASDVP